MSRSPRRRGSPVPLCTERRLLASRSSTSEGPARRDGLTDWVIIGAAATAAARLRPSRRWGAGEVVPTFGADGCERSEREGLGARNRGIRMILRRRPVGARTRCAVVPSWSRRGRWVVLRPTGGQGVGRTRARRHRSSPRCRRRSRRRKVPTAGRRPAWPRSRDASHRVCPQPILSTTLAFGEGWMMVRIGNPFPLTIGLPTRRTAHRSRVCRVRRVGCRSMSHRSADEAECRCGGGLRAGVRAAGRRPRRRDRGPGHRSGGAGSVGSDLSAVGHQIRLLEIRFGSP